MTPVSVLLDVRKARQRRWSLVVLTASAVVLPFFSGLLPRWAQYFSPATVGAVLLPGLPALFAAGAAAWVGQEGRWALADDIAWLLCLVALAVLSAMSAAPFGVAMVLYGVAMVLLATRVPPPRVVLLAGLSAPLAVLTRAVSHQPVLPTALAVGLITFAHVTLARATHSLVFVLAEREALLQERRGSGRSRDERRPRSRSVPSTRPEMPAVEGGASPAVDDNGWEGLVERLRVTVTALCESAGVVSTVHAELRGLAPPSSKMRQGVLKIVQEATHQALRDTAPANLAVTLRRAEGGLVMEVLDDGDGPNGEGQRARRTVATLKGRVVSLGGSAEVKRGDVGWVVRVKIPCEQLN
ncbi:MAG: hypothetical protein JNK72_25625 [Myxococcales bacterium]|nr:hypothetical protein [Myxococcales bacterium]